MLNIHAHAELTYLNILNKYSALALSITDTKFIENLYSSISLVLNHNCILSRKKIRSLYWALRSVFSNFCCKFILFLVSTLLKHLLFTSSLGYSLLISKKFFSACFCVPRAKLKILDMTLADPWSYPVTIFYVQGCTYWSRILYF